MFIQLNEDEFDLCVQVALRRQHSASVKKLRDSVKQKRDWIDSLEGHIKGTVGEMAVAKALNLSWTGSVDVFKSVPDIGKNIEVRHRGRPDWDLLIRDGDSDDAVYILSRGLPPSVIEVCGWMKGKDAKQKKWMHKYGNLRPAYFVPAEELHRLEELGV